MKKLVLLLTLVAGLFLANANAQGGDPAAREARMKEMKAQLIEKAKLSEAQADKVLEINTASREQMRGLRDLSEGDRAKKMEEIQADLSKKFKAIPLTDEQVKAVNDYMAERRRNFQPPPGGNN
jgi:DNA uptake protein ComE-like DNA-binding protein